MTSQPHESDSAECTCTFTEHTSAFDPACFYHGDNGTMVSVIDLSLLRSTTPTKPFEPLTGGPRSQACPHCGREI